MKLLDLIALGLATSAIVAGWRHGSIFATARAKVEVLAGEHDRSGSRRLLWAALLDCAFCLSYWAPLVPALLLAAAACWPRWSPFWQLPVYALAATRLSWLLNVLLPEDLRY
jgi:hypothetical protein